MPSSWDSRSPCVCWASFNGTKYQQSSHLPSHSYEIFYEALWVAGCPEEARFRDELYRSRAEKTHDTVRIGAVLGESMASGCLSWKPYLAEQHCAIA